MSSHEPPLPRRIGRYEIESELGRGAMGVVYRARDPAIDRTVALKTLSIPVGTDRALAQQLKERFINEARAAGSLSHPNIVTVYDADEDLDAGVAFMVMEMVEGADLRVLVGRGLPAERALGIAAEIAAALDHAHERGIVHRDVKPGNILVGPGGHAKLADFGVAKVGDTSVTLAGEMLGSPAYCSPEQVRRKEVGPAADVFSLGVVLYEALTGQRPFGGDDLISTAHAIVSGGFEPASIVNPELSPSLDEVFARALAKTPEERYASAGELAAAAQLGVQGTAAPIDETASPASPTGRVSQLIIGAIVLALVASVFFGRPSDDEEAMPTPAAPPAVSTSPTAEPVETDTPLPSAGPTEQATKTTPPTEPTPDPGPPPRPSAPGPRPRVTNVPTLSTTAPSADTAPLAMARLKVQIFTLQLGTLEVRADGKVLGTKRLGEEETSTRKIRNPKKHFEFGFDLPAGRHDMSFTFVPKKAGREVLHANLTLRCGTSKATHVELNVGVRGKKLEAKLR